MKSQKGFTLLELLIVIIIIGVLTILFIPAFRQAREATLNDEARANLKLIKAAERAFHMQNGVYYYNTTSNCEASINANLKTSLQVGIAGYPKRWNYTINTLVSLNPYNITAVRNPGGIYNRILWIDYLNEEPQCVSGGFCK